MASIAELKLPVPIQGPKHSEFKQINLSERMFALDVLRGLAISLVLIRHLPASNNDLAAFKILLLIRSIGWSGVDLFFVLSGFLISRLLFKEFDRSSTLDMPRFWMRRGMKIWPSYLVVYVGALLLNGAANLRSGDVAALKQSLIYATPNLLFIQNYFPFPCRWMHSWSLAIEEHFYLSLPVFLLLYQAFCSRFKQRKGFEGLILPLSLFCIAVLFLRLTTSDMATWEDLYYPTHFRADSLCFGVILGYLHNYHSAWVRKFVNYWPILLGSSFAILMTMLYFPLEAYRFSFTFGFTLLYIAYGTIVMIAGVFPEFGNGTGVRNLLPRAFAWTGVYSYTIYLTHSVIYQLPLVTRLRSIVSHAFGAVWPDQILFVVLSISSGVFVSHTIERPFLGLRAKWFPSTQQDRVLEQNEGKGQQLSS